MGFMSIDIVGSDMASDLNWQVKEWLGKGEKSSKRKSVNEAVTELDKELIVDHGPFNTPGITNVALVLTEGGAWKWLKKSRKLKPLIEKTFKGMEYLIKLSDEATGWDSEDNKQYHIQRATEIKADLENVLEKLNKSLKKV